MNKEALIVFTKNPELGKVKTRLAKEIGSEKALKIYLQLLNITYLQTKKLSCQKFLYLSENRDKNLFDNSFEQILQNGNDLGERMKNAFDEVFEKGFKNIIIIGSDCPDLTSNIIEDGFNKLDSNDFVIGPSNDGGYYLLGMKSKSDFLFGKMRWSSEEVIRETIKRIKGRKLNYFLLERLLDIDNEKDLRVYEKFF